MATLITVSIGTDVGRDYSTINAGISDNFGATSQDLVANDEDVLVELYADSDFNEDSTITGWTVDATHRIRLGAATGESPVINRQNTQSASHVITVSSHYTEIFGLTILNWKASSSYNNIGHRAISSNVQFVKIYNNKMCVSAPASSFNYMGISLGGSNPNTNYGQAYNNFVNCLKGGNTGIGFDLASGTSGSGALRTKFFNNLAYNCKVGFNGLNTQCLVQSNISLNNTTNWTGTFASDSLLNIDDDGSAPGAGNLQTTQTLNGTFFTDTTTPCSEDFTPPAGSDALYNGCNLTINANGDNITEDINGVTRVSNGAWTVGPINGTISFAFSIGADELDSITPSGGLDGGSSLQAMGVYIGVGFSPVM